jgi:hypothetical protein
LRGAVKAAFGSAVTTPSVFSNPQSDIAVRHDIARRYLSAFVAETAKRKENRRRFETRVCRRHGTLSPAVATSSSRATPYIENSTFVRVKNR